MAFPRFGITAMLTPEGELLKISSGRSGCSRKVSPDLAEHRFLRRWCRIWESIPGPLWRVTVEMTGICPRNTVERGGLLPFFPKTERCCGAFAKLSEILCDRTCNDAYNSRIAFSRQGGVQVNFQDIIFDLNVSGRNRDASSSNRTMWKREREP